MKRITLACLCFLALLCSQCKKDSDTDTDNSTENKLATVMTVQSGAIGIYSDVLASTGDSIEATNEMAEWLVTQAEVKSVYYLEGGIFEVYYTNGLRSSIVLVAADASGQHLTRGGGLGNKLANFKSSGIQSPVKIKNEKVLILNPFVDEFNGGTYNKDALFEGGDVTFDVNTVNGNNVGLDDINAMGDYGFTILNTHGLRYGFILFKVFAAPQPPRTETWTSEEISAMLAQHGAPADKFANGELELTSLAVSSLPNTVGEVVAFTVTERYIRNMNVDLSASVVLGNHCYSGYTMDGPDTNNLPEAWRSKGVATYYGYAFNGGFSQPVLNEFCKVREDSLIVNLCRNTDSTGVAHLDPSDNKYFYMVELAAWSKYVVRGEAVMAVATTRPPDPPAPFYFYHFLEPNYTYKSCGDTMIDGRDMQVYKTVCIGNQVWMAENLNWAGAGVCYDSVSTHCDTYGRLYSITEATGQVTSETNPSGIQGVCPPGWHMPSRAELQELIDFCGGINEAATKLRATTGWPSPNGNTDAYGFKLLPGGMYYSSTWSSFFQNLNEGAVLWTTSFDSGNGFYTSFNCHGTTMAFGGYDGPPQYNWKFSCRCVKD